MYEPVKIDSMTSKVVKNGNVLKPYNFRLELHLQKKNVNTVIVEIHSEARCTTELWRVFEGKMGIFSYRKIHKKHTKTHHSQRCIVETKNNND